MNFGVLMLHHSYDIYTSLYIHFFVKSKQVFPVKVFETNLL